MIFQALDGLFDLAASTNAQSSNDGHPGYRVDNMYDMRFLVDHDHNDSVSGDIDFFLVQFSNILLFYHWIGHSFFSEIVSGIVPYST